MHISLSKTEWNALLAPAAYGTSARGGIFVLENEIALIYVHSSGDSA